MIELIAEASTGHGGDIALAKEFIHAFAEAGANFVKFQHTRVKHLRPDDPQYEWFRQCEMTVEQFAELNAECERAGTQFLTTVYHAADVPEVASLGLTTIKIGSGEAMEKDLATAVTVYRFPRIMVGCGLCQPSEIAFSGAAPRVDRLKCVTRYPAPSFVAHGFYGVGNPWTGYSDHSIGLDGCCIAILEGATIIETHVQLPRRQARDPKPFEKTVQEFRQLRAFADEDPTRFIGRWQFT